MKENILHTQATIKRRGLTFEHSSALHSRRISTQVSRESARTGPGTDEEAGRDELLLKKITLLIGTTLLIK